MKWSGSLADVKIPPCQRPHSGAAGILWIQKQRAGDLPCQRAQDDHNTVARVFFFIIVIENKISFTAIKPLLTEEILGKGITVSASDPWLLCWSWLSKNSRLVRRNIGLSPFLILAAGRRRWEEGFGWGSQDNSHFGTLSARHPEAASNHSCPLPRRSNNILSSCTPHVLQCFSYVDQIYHMTQSQML